MQVLYTIYSTQQSKLEDVKLVIAQHQVIFEKKSCIAVSILLFTSVPCPKHGYRIEGVVLHKVRYTFKFNCS